jgi:DUF2075 family protein/DNA replication protein DnaC
MTEIQTFNFSEGELSKIKEYRLGYNWPVVYLLENGTDIYIGESTNAYHRSCQHSKTKEKRKHKNMHIISDEYFNKSAALDIESLLIEHIVADEKYIVQNGNGGISGHNYFDREMYQAKFQDLWEKLRQLSLVQKDLRQIKNSQIFKYSPYKNLTEDQFDIAEKIKDILKNTEAKSIIVNGGPGTGKTILATHLKIGFVVPMTSLRKTIQRVFSKVKGLKSKMVIGPQDVVGGNYDLVLVDEAHRLKQRKNITNYQTFDGANKKLGLTNEGTELDWILKSSKHQIFFYDKNQSVRPADIEQGRFAKMDAVRLNLHKQKRVKGGERYIQYIEDMLNLEPSECNFEEYDFKIFDSVSEMIDAIKEKDEQYGLSRVVAGYAWSWKTKKGTGYDIDIDGLKLVWNSTASDWVNSKNSINEVGCIHTVQGYDLNYTGVIIGPEISYNPDAHEIVVHKDKYQDINGKRAVSSPGELKSYILNIYKTLLTRGIYGTYVYVSDPHLRKYIKDASLDINFT